LTTALLLLTCAASLAAGPAPLADSLFLAGDYAGAATEFRRALFSGPPGDSSGVLLRLGLSLGLAGELDRAARFFALIPGADTAARHAGGTALAGLLVRQGDLEEAQLTVLELRTSIDAAGLRPELDGQLAWLNARLGRPDAAAASLKRAGRDADAAIARSAGAGPRRSASTAALLSSILPGTGELYAGRPGAGLLSFAVNAGTGAGIYFAARDEDWVGACVLFVFGFMRFYNGSRANAADFAEEFNRRQRQLRLDALVAERLGEPDWFVGVRRATGLAPPTGP